MRLTWVTFSHAQRRPDGSLTAAMASLRLRVLVPIRELTEFQHRLAPMVAGADPGLWDTALDADMLIFSKSFEASNEALLREAQARGLRVIFDVCDNHYENEEYGAHYRQMSALADQVICNSPEMARIAEPYCARPPVIIEDPYEGLRGEPRFAPGERLRLLWFGHPTNLDSLQETVGELVRYGAGRPLSLTVLTQLNPALEATAARLTERLSPAFEMYPQPWSLAAQWDALAVCDAVVIPSLPNARKQVKSANRMIEALWAGRPVVAQPLPAYQPFARWTPVKPTLTEGLALLEAHQSEVPRLISEAQSYIETRHAPAVLGRQWAQVIRNTLSQEVAAR